MKHILSTALLGLLSASFQTAYACGDYSQLEPARPKVEVAFVLDTTGSMGGLIEGAKLKIWSIANEIAAAKPSPEVKFGLIGYRDITDDYVTKTYDLSDDLDDIYDKLMGFNAAGGGDGPEAVNQALHESVTELSWSDDGTVLKIIFLVGDAPPHMDYQDDVKYPITCALAREKDIIINTIQCGNMSRTQAIWQTIAQHSAGEYVAIQQSGGMHAVSTPLDEDIARLNSEMAATVITYGDSHAQTLGKSKVANAIAATPEAAASRYNYFAASSDDSDAAPIAISGSEDLVAQLANDAIDQDEIKQDYLPETLQSLTPEALQQHIAEQSEKRSKIQVELNELLNKRQSYIDTEKAGLTAEGNTDSFDTKVNEMIQAQAARKGISYTE